MRVRVHRVDEDGGWRRVRRRSSIIGAGPKRRPFTAFGQERHDVAAAQLAYVAARIAFKSNEFVIARRASAFAVAQVDYDALERASCTAIDANNTASTGRGVDDASARAVFEKRLATFYRVTLFDFHAGTHARKVVRHDRNTGRLANFPHDLDRVSRDRKVEPLGDLVK